MKEKIRFSAEDLISTTVPRGAHYVQRIASYLLQYLLDVMRAATHHHSDTAMHYCASRVTARKGLLKETLLLKVWAAFLFMALIFSVAQSFVLVPSQQQIYSLHITSAHRRGCIMYRPNTALFVRSSDQRRRQPASRDNNPAFAINKRLVELGQKKQWRELLEVVEEEQERFNNVNYGTVMSQLGRIKSFNKADPRFLSFLKALVAMLEEQGLPWIQARQAANVVHAIGKMNLRNPGTKRILEWISQPKVAAHFVEEGEPQHVANVAWSCATLGFEAPNLFAKIERQSKWLVEKGNPQNVANTAWACATLSFEAPNLFANIEQRSKWLVEEGTPQNVANTAWSCAKLGYEAPKLFAEIECQSKWLVKE